MGIFAQDQWTFKRLTANYGVRLDFLNAMVEAQDLPAGPFTPARNFEEVQNVPNWKDVNPRFGVAYDLFGNGKTALKASIGRYVVADAYAISRAVNPVNSSVNRRPGRGPRPSGTFNPFNDCDLRNPRPTDPADRSPTPRSAPGAHRTTNYDPTIVDGWGVRPVQLGGAGQHPAQIVPRVSVYAGYSRRWFGNLFVTTNRAVTNASYTPYSINLPTARRSGLPVPNGGAQQCGYYDLIRPTTPNNLVQSANNFGGVEDVYDGFDFDANARLGRGIILSGGVSIGRERTNSCNLANDLSLVFQSGVGAGTGSGGGILAPRTSAYCDVHPPFQPNVKGQLTYPIPGGILGSLTFQSLAGAQINAQYPLTNTTPGLTLGRTFTSVPPTVDIVPPGTVYLERIYQTDIRFSKKFKAGADDDSSDDLGLQPVQREPDEHQQPYTARYGAAWLAPTVILTPRFVDFGVQIDF